MNVTYIAAEKLCGDCGYVEVIVEKESIVQGLKSRCITPLRGTMTS